MATDDEYFVTGRRSLAPRRAGVGAREKAKEELAAAPVRSRVARILRVHTGERAWRRGADGEERTERILNRLPESWRAFHDLTIGSRGANIDHLVIGPGGVFTINTKNLTGRAWVASRALMHNGRKTGYLQSVVREATTASRCLTRAIGRPVVAVPVLAIFVESLTIKSEPTEVRVVRGERLAKWLTQQPVVLSGSERLAIASAADDPGTWHR